MAIDKLGLYNIALMAVGERTLDALSDEGEPRRLLDEVYTRGNGAVKYFLEQGHWNHAMRAVKIDKSTSVEPSFGFTNAFAKPSDFVRLNMISADENFDLPLEEFEFEGDFIFANVDPLYFRYVSDDGSWGGDFSRWPDTFILWGGTWMATQIAPKLLNDTDLGKLEDRARKLLVDARSKDASQEPPRYRPLSSWASSRHNRFGTRNDRGIRSRLTGF